MIRTIRFILFIGFVLMLTSCFKKDEAIAPHPKGDIVTDTIPMTINYTYQLYFDLSANMVVLKNRKTASDLGFDCSADGWKIILNTANFMKVADIGAVPFGAKYDTAGLVWKFDKSDGNADSNAVGRWFRVAGSDTISGNHLYILNRGIDENANSLGFSQVIFDSLRKGIYYFRFADLSGANVHSGMVQKDGTVNYLFYSLAGGGSLQQLEPPSDMYDLLFTQYSTLLFTDAGQAYPYLVTGVLINPVNTEVAVDSIHSFNAISYQDVSRLTFSNTLDVIGYDWKYYSSVTGAYTVRTGVNYVIHTRQGYYFRLRFIGFYNNKGEKGYPVIEFQRL